MKRTNAATNDDVGLLWLEHTAPSLIYTRNRLSSRLPLSCSLVGAIGLSTIVF